MKAIEATTPGMYYVEWDDGSRSDDYYNKTRALYYCSQIGRRIELEARGCVILDTPVLPYLEENNSPVRLLARCKSIAWSWIKRKVR